MAFMQPEITVKMRGWSVETRDAGTCFVPGDVCSVPAWLMTGVPVDNSSDRLYSALFEALKAELADYIEGHTIESIEVCHGYFARMQAPGYLDCTEWCCYSTVREARRALRED